MKQHQKQLMMEHLELEADWLKQNLRREKVSQQNTGQHTIHLNQKKGEGNCPPGYSENQVQWMSPLYSVRNVEAIREQMHQIDGVFKMLIEVHREYSSSLPLEMQEQDGEWFDDIEEKNDVIQK